MKLPTDAPRNQTPIIRPAIARRRELGHRAQADRAQAQLAERVEQVGRRSATSALTCAPPLGACCAAATRTAKPSADADAGRARTWPGSPARVGPSRRPRARRTPARSTMMNSALTDWNQLLGNSQPRIDVARAAVGEQVQRRPGLLEHRPEERGGEEEDADDVQPLALDRRPRRRRGTASRRRRPCTASSRQPAASAICSAVTGITPVCDRDAEQHERGEPRRRPRCIARRFSCAPLPATPRAPGAARRRRGSGRPSTYCTRPSTMPTPAARKARGAS